MTEPPTLGALRLESVRKPFRGERLLAHNFIVGAGTILAGLLGVAFQVMASHRLRPGDFGAVFAVITLVTLIGLPAGAFSLLMARETSRGIASGRQEPSATLLRRGTGALLLVGLAIASAIAVASPILSRFLAVPPEFLLAAAPGIPFGLALPLLMGEFQGQQRFVEYASLSTGQAALKLGAAVVLGLAFGPLGIVAGISIATVVVYAIALRLLRRKLSMRANLDWWRPAASYLAVVLPSTIALAMLLSADVLLVKHYFPAGPAGQYGAVAALGRAVFWGASGVAIVLFPKIATRGAQGRSDLQLVGASLILVALGGVFGFALLSFGSTWLLTAFAGNAYLGAASYLPWYTAGMVLLGGVAVLIATQQSRGKPAFLAVLLPMTLVEPTLIALFHQTLLQVVQVIDLSMLGIFVALGALYVAQERGNGPEASVFAGSSSGMVAAQARGNQ